MYDEKMKALSTLLRALDPRQLSNEALLCYAQLLLWVDSHQQGLATRPCPTEQAAEALEKHGVNGAPVPDLGLAPELDLPPPPPLVRLPREGTRNRAVLECVRTHPAVNASRVAGYLGLVGTNTKSGTCLASTALGQLHRQGHLERLGHRPFKYRLTDATRASLAWGGAK